MNSFSNFIGRLPSSVVKGLNVSYVSIQYFYGFVILMSCAYGTKKGLEQFLTWKQSRRYIKLLKFKNIEEMVNVSCDVGTCAYYMFVNGSMNAIIGATFPISMPLLLYLCVDKEK